MSFTIILFFAANYNGKLVTSTDNVGVYDTMESCEKTAYELSRSNKLIKEVVCVPKGK